MSWCHEDAPGHEGYPVALDFRTDGIDRIVELRGDVAPRYQVHLACAGCDCGWRSERITVVEPMIWDGYFQCSDRVRDRLERLWIEHRALVAYRIEVAHGRDRAACGDRLVGALSSVERCTCGHERRQHGTGGSGWPFCTGWDDFVIPLGQARRQPAASCPCRKFVFMPSPA